MSKTFEELAERACRPLTKGADYRTQALIGALTGGATGALSGYISADEGETRKQMLRQGLIGALAGGVGFPAVAHAFKAPKRPQAAPTASSKAEAKAPPKAEALVPKAEAPKPEAPKAPPRVEDLPPPKPGTRVDGLVRKNVPFADSDNPAFDYGQVAGESAVGAGAGYAGSRAYQARNTTTPRALIQSKDAPGLRVARPGLAAFSDEVGPGVFQEAVRLSDGDPRKFKHLLINRMLDEQARGVTVPNDLEAEAAALRPRDSSDKHKPKAPKTRQAIEAEVERGTRSMRDRWVNTPGHSDKLQPLTEEIVKARRGNARLSGAGGAVALPFLTESARDYLDSRAAINQGAK